MSLQAHLNVRSAPQGAAVFCFETERSKRQALADEGRAADALGDFRQGELSLAELMGALVAPFNRDALPA